MERLVCQIIYIVHPDSKELTKVMASRFSDIGIKERDDLEEWVISHPEVLGEELLVISPEYDRFDKAARRLDILALDKVGKLVVVELKLEVENTFADLQAIRYAAFCSTMRIEQLVETYAAFLGQPEEVAIQKIKEFLYGDELPKLDSQPRVILAASSMDNIELTSTVLWLRNFGVDISCIELTPYRINTASDENRIILVPRTIIPLPETKEYQVSVERKQAEQAQHDKLLPLESYWKELLPRFNNSCPVYKVTLKPRNNYWYLPVEVGLKDIHYEWVIRNRKQCVEVALHFETDDKDFNRDMCSRFYSQAKDICTRISTGSTCAFKFNQHGKKWSSCYFEIPFSDNLTSERTISLSAKVMSEFIVQTIDILRESIT